MIAVSSSRASRMTKWKLSFLPQTCRLFKLYFICNASIPLRLSANSQPDRSGRVVEWQISTTTQFNWLGEVAFTCSDEPALNGYRNHTYRVGFNGTVDRTVNSTLNSTAQFCPTTLNPAVAVDQPDNEGVFPIRQYFLLVPGFSHRPQGPSPSN